MPDFYQPLEQERFTTRGCIINHLYGDKSILRKERGMCCCGLLWLRQRVDIKKNIMQYVLYASMVLLCEIWQFLKPFPSLPILWLWYFLFLCGFISVKGSDILGWDVLQKHSLAIISEWAKEISNIFQCCTRLKHVWGDVYISWGKHSNEFLLNSGQRVKRAQCDSYQYDAIGWNHMSAKALLRIKIIITGVISCRGPSSTCCSPWKRRRDKT